MILALLLGIRPLVQALNTRQQLVARQDRMQRAAAQHATAQTATLEPTGRSSGMLTAQLAAYAEAHRLQLSATAPPTAIAPHPGEEVLTFDLLLDGAYPDILAFVHQAERELDGCVVLHLSTGPHRDRTTRQTRLRTDVTLRCLRHLHD